MNDVDVWPYSLPLRTPWRTGRSRTTKRDGFIVQLGRSYGDAAVLPGAPPQALLRVGKQLRAPRQTLAPGPARNALIQAGLSEQARGAGVPLGAFLGQDLGRTPRRQVTVNATLPVLPTGRAVSSAKRLVREGYGTLKLKVGAGAADWKRVEAVRDAVGPRIRLRLDPNGTWPTHGLASRLERLEPLNIEYVEQPFASKNPKQFLRWAARSPIPFAPDEQADSLASVQALLADGVLEYVVVKPMMLGGPDKAAQAIQLVEDAGAIPVVTDILESGVGRMGALHVASLTRDETVAHGLAGGTLLRRDLVNPPLVPKRGALRVPSGAGLGIRVRRPPR